MSIERYRIIDLALLCITGIVLEFAGVWLISIFLPWVVPVFTVTIIILTTAIVRWGPVGIILAPILALATYLAGLFVLQNHNSMQLPPNYFVDLAYAISAGILIPIIKRNGYKNSFDAFWKRFSSSIAIYILGAIIGGIILGGYGYNIFASIGVLLVQQLMSLTITVVIIDLLYRQEILVNVKEKMLERKKELEEEREYYKSREKG